MKEIKPKLLKPQEELRATPDTELIEKLYSSYRSESRHTDKSIKERGDKKRRNLWVTDKRRCPREMYYWFYQPEKARPYTDKGLVIFADGKLHHKDMQGRLESMRYADHPGGFLEDPEIGTTGYYDDLIVLGTENGWQICDIAEFKTKYASAMTEINQDDYDQLQYYLWMAKFSKWLKERRIKIKGGRLGYKDRGLMGDEVYLAWRVEPDKQRQAELRDYYKWLHQTIVIDKQICQRPYERDSIKCTYCLFKDYCWQGVPEIDEPELLPDVSIEKPEMELVESAQNRYIQLKENMTKEEEELKKLRDVLIRYFKATGTKEIEKIMYCHNKTTAVDRDYLLKELKDKWHIIADPKIALLKKAIEDGEINPEIFERAKISIFNDSLRIKKGGINANKKP